MALLNHSHIGGQSETSIASEQLGNPFVLLCKFLKFVMLGYFPFR